MAFPRPGLRSFPCFLSRSALRSPWLRLSALLALVGGSLACTNPGPEDFADFAGRRLVAEISREFCEGDRLPALLRLALADCAELVASQHEALGALVLQQTERTNLGLMSIYRSELGGQEVLGWRIPRYETTVLGLAGQLVLVEGREASTGTAP